MMDEVHAVQCVCACVRVCVCVCVCVCDNVRRSREMCYGVSSGVVRCGQTQVIVRLK